MNSTSRALFWALTATALYSVAAALAKLAAARFHVLEILFLRQSVVLASTLPMIAPGFPASLSTRRPGLHALRILGAFAALGGGIWAVAVLPLATAITLGFAQVFFMGGLGALVLGEPLGRARLLAMVLGFAGVLVVMRPGVEGLVDLRALIPLAAALGAAVATVCVRVLSQTDSTATLLAWQSLMILPVAGIPLFWLWQSPGPAEAALMLAMGLAATSGQWAGIRALRLGEAGLVGNIEYMKLVYATLLGLALFGEWPDGATLAGAALIVLAAVLIARRGGRTRS